MPLLPLLIAVTAKRWLAGCNATEWQLASAVFVKNGSLSPGRRNRTLPLPGWPLVTTIR